MIMLVVVMAIVLLLVAKNWRAVAPTAMQVADPELQSSGPLPDLNDMRQQTDVHAEQLQEALEATE